MGLGLGLALFRDFCHIGNSVTGTNKAGSEEENKGNGDGDGDWDDVG